MTHKKTKNPITLDPSRLFKQAVIGCTVLPSRDDPDLSHGVALTTLNAYDENYVKFEDIDGMGEPSYRYWKDVFLIIGYNNTNYKSLKIGDKIFALFQNMDNTFTTVYYNAQVRQLPMNNKITIDFLDGTGQYKNIKMILYTNIQTKDGIIKVPTVIHKICAQNTKVHKKAIEKYQKTKKNKHIKSNNYNNNKSKKSAQKYEKPKVNSPKYEISKVPKKSVQKYEKLNAAKSNPKIKHEIPKISQNKTKNKRKRKYEQMNNNTNINTNTNNNNTIQQPPLKRQRSRAKKQKLKIPPNKINTITSKVPKNIQNVMPIPNPIKSKPPKLNKKISLKIKKRNVRNIVKNNNQIVEIPSLLNRQRNHNQNFVAPPPAPVPVPAPAPMPVANVSVPIAMGTRVYTPVNDMNMRPRKKLKKMWGNYEIEMPVIEMNNNFEFKLFENKDLTMNDMCSKDDKEYFVSGLEMKTKWIKPQEIGEITVGPYVVDIDMFNVV